MRDAASWPPVIGTGEPRTIDWIQGFVNWIQSMLWSAPMSERVIPARPSARARLLDPQLAAIGVVGGVLSGLLGVGGGVVMVPLLVLWAGP